MTKKDFLDSTLKMFYEYAECNLNDFEVMLDGIVPVFGELETKIEKLENGKKITFKDIHIVEKFITPDGVEVEKEPIDMSTKILVMTLDDDGIIKTVDAGISLITAANKDMCLYFASLISKKLNI